MARTDSRQNVDLRALKKVRCRFLDQATGMPVAGVVVSLAIAADDKGVSAITIGTLRSDTAGYVAFDLGPLIARGLRNAGALLLTAAKYGLRNHDLLSTLGASGGGLATHGALGDDLTPAPEPLYIEFPVHLGPPTSAPDTDDCGCESIALASVQAPDLGDYTLSPYSFVTPVRISTGGDCCETLAPTTQPVQQHEFSRVVVRYESDAVPNTTLGGPVDVTSGPPTPPAALVFGEVLEYQQSWYALGHSLGEIKYSLPLAPGESTQLAMIEWSRQDEISRSDTVVDKEYLKHQQKRDRSIDESITAGLSESQGGWSWLGGMSTGAAYDAGPYGKYTGNAGVGGAISNSWGNRDLEGDSLQDLHDKITQGTSVVRSLTSTVIVQASQAEENVLQTRRVANHNHCHALTIQYYEVLRSFRIETRFRRRRKVVLVPFAPLTFGWEVALRYRTVLQSALLDPALAAGFDAMVRLHLALGAYSIGAPPSSQPTDTTNYFAGTKTYTVSAAAVTDGSAMIEKGSSVAVSAFGQGIKFTSIDLGSGYGPQGSTQIADNQYPSSGMHALALLAQVGGDFYEIGAGATFTAKNSGSLRFQFNDFKLDDNAGAAVVTMTVTRPEQDSDPATTPPQATYDKATDELAEATLLAHLDANNAYYNRVVWTQMDPGERRLCLTAGLGSGSALLAGIDDTPLAVSGNLVAFPYDGPIPGWSDTREGDPVEPLTAIVTLPTRGLFAEAQLGHCNSCEKRDATRMWDWTEATVEEPPAITGIQPGPKGQTPSLTPLQLPAAVVQIAGAPTEPDPAGLKAALATLGTTNLFRDMSGLDQASALLGKLVDGTTKTLEDMVKGAGEAKDKVDAVRSNQGANQAGGGDTKSNQPSAKDLADKFSLLPEIKNFAKDLGLDAGETKIFAREIMGTSTSGGTSSGSVQDVLRGATINLARYCTPGVRAFSPSGNVAGTGADKSGTTTVRAVVTNAPAGSTWHWSVARPASAQIVAPSAYITDIVAGEAGETDLMFEARGPDGTSLGKATTKLSVPQFVVIDEEAATLDAQLTAYHLYDVKAAVLQRTKDVVDILLRNANVRTLWRLAPFAEALPPQLAAGGFAAGKFNTLTIHGAAPSPGLAGRTGTAGGIGLAKADEPIDVYPGAYTSPGNDIAADVAAIVAKLAAANITDPQLKTLWIEILARLLGETIGHEIHHSLLGLTGFDATGHNSPTIPFDLMNRGAERGWLQRTGIEIIDAPNFPAPGSYRDGGVFAISGLLQSNQNRIDATLPVPPALL